MDKKAKLAANQDLQAELSGCQREVEVLRSELEMSTAILNTVDAIALIFDPKGRIVYCNSSFEQITGYTLQEVKNQLFWELCNQHERKSVKAVFEKIQQDLMAFTYEHNWITKNGSSQSIAWDYTPYLDSDGAVKYVIGIGNNITSKPQAELATQECLAQLEAQNCLLEARDRILEATASAANALLTLENFDEAINTALQIIGESLDTDRVTVIENFDNPSDPSSVYWRMLYEWNSLHAVSQICHPNLAQGSYEGIEEWYELCYQGQGVGCLLEDMPEPFRSGQAELGVKALHTVPIFVEGKFWGVVGFDDCHEAKRRSSVELAVLRIAADCIGSAIQRDATKGGLPPSARDRRACEEAELMVLLEREKAASERAAELAKANEALKRSLTMLADEPSLDNFLGYVLQTIADQLGDRSGAVYLYSEPHNTTLLHLNYENGHLQQGDRITHPAVTLPRPPKEWDDQYLPLLRQNQLLIHHACEFDSPAYAPYRQHNLDRGIQTLLIVPMLFGDQLLGSLTLRSTQPRDYTPEELELACALAQQATLALQLTKLAEQRRQQAIAREQEKAALEQAAELAKANEMLARTSVRLADQPDLSAFLAHITLEAVAQLGADAGHLTILNEQRRTLCTAVQVEQGNVMTISPLAVEMSIDEAEFLQILLETRKPRFFDLEQEAHLFWTGAAEYHRQRNHCAVLSVPLYAGGTFLGHFGLAFAHTHSLTDQGAELLQALAHQAALAIQLTRLAEEAKFAAIARAEEAKQAAILEERNRIAREIHDTLAQGFTGVIVQLEATKRKISSAQLEAAQTHITRARSLAAEGLSEARRSVQALRPETLESRNLPDALCYLAEQMTCAPTTQITVQIEGSPYALPVEVETNLLRIAQEALTNALRHAQAQTVCLELRFQTAAVHLHITDDGQGFNPKSQLMNPGFGLIGMQERSQRLGGQFTLTSRVGQGTEIAVLVPI